MHQVYFVLVPHKNGLTPQRAIQEAESFLEENNFSGEGGLYSTPKADWYEVGGRWSGLLTEIQDWYKPYAEKIDKLLKTDYAQIESGVKGVFYGDKAKEALKEKAAKHFEQIWKKMRPKNYPKVSSPISRHAQMSLGFSDDDAMRLTPELIDKLQSKEWGDVEAVKTDESVEDYISGMDAEELLKYWVVIIDYH